MTNREIIAAVNEAWAWTGTTFTDVTALSPFGHLILRDLTHRYYYCDPEMLALTEIAPSDEALFAHMSRPDVRATWEARWLVEAAEARLGPAGAGNAYSWKTPPIFGGSYEADNMAITPIVELLHHAGSLAEQLKGVPDGAQIQLKVVE